MEINLLHVCVCLAFVYEDTQGQKHNKLHIMTPTDLPSSGLQGKGATGVLREKGHNSLGYKLIIIIIRIYNVLCMCLNDFRRDLRQ